MRKGTARPRNRALMNHIDDRLPDSLASRSQESRS